MENNFEKLLAITQRLREKAEQASNTLDKLERSIALRALHPELGAKDTYRTTWMQVNKSLYRPKYNLEVHINGVVHTHKPEDVPEPLLKTMPTGRSKR